MATIHDVAQKAGVSVASVSRTFSSPELMNDQTRQRILEAARALDYRPRQRRTPVDANAGSTANRCIGFQFFAADATDNLQSNTFYASMLAGAQAEASTLGLYLMLDTTDRHAMRQEMPRMVLEQAVAGMLLVGTAEPAILDAFAQHVPQIVLLDNRDSTGRYESVLSDGFGGAYAAVKHLLETGHRRIGFFVSEPEVTTFMDRLRGYRAALCEAGAVQEDRWIVSGRNEEESLRSLEALLRSPECPTALVAANDEHALDIVQLCRRIGLKIPGDLSLIGFDDVPFSRHIEPPLTTVRVNKEFMGRLAVRRLNARIQQALTGEEAEPAISIHVPVALVSRGSCRAV
jgi:DNA-binding LacI/PurR family transcriptional regulator